MNIVSPMALGNGAYIVHRLLERKIPGYRVIGYNPLYTLFPFALPLIAPTPVSSLLHTTPDYAIFFHRPSCPMVLTFHNYVLDRDMRPYSSLIQNFHYLTDLRMWIRMALQNAPVLTAVSWDTAHRVEKDLNLSTPVRVIHNGVDVERFSPSYGNAHSGNEIKVLFSGNLSRRKGTHWLAEIASRLDRDVRLYYTQGLRGRGSLNSHPHLRLIKPLPHGSMPDLYRQMDILLVPSVREGFSLTVLEAMACGLPVVASNCSSLPEQIDHRKGGFLCRVGDTADFAEKINLLSGSIKLRNEMGQYNRTRVEEHFTINRMVDEYRLLFEEVLDKHVCGQD